MEVLTAIAEGNAQELASVLADGADPQVVDTEGVPALLHAADTGRVDLVKPLLQAGADLAAVDNIGWNALMAAIAASAEDLVEFLLMHGANANHVAREDTPLTIAAAEAPITIVRMLLDHGADPDLRRPDGWTPLMLAAFVGDATRVKLLLEQGADPTVTMGSRLVDAATVAAAHNHADVRDLLMDAMRSLAPDLGELWGGIQKWCEGKAPELAARFENTVGNAEVPDAWRDLPPEAEKQLTGWASGLPFYDYAGLGLDEAIAVWTTMNDRAENGEFIGRKPSALGPDEPVARQYWNDHWVPVARDQDGNLLLVDLDPATHGIPGQLVSWSSEQGPLSVLASGLTPYLRLLAARLRGGRLKLDKRSGGLIPK
ncbi:MAG: ankyrin repeat domain-containing protein [Alphaproteobacteria bacterium]|nr:ankyrin repeat domain-containing protein [Alphaproteobacteria bacterium]